MNIHGNDKVLKEIYDSFERQYNNFFEHVPIYGKFDYLVRIERTRLIRAFEETNRRSVTQLENVLLFSLACNNATEAALAVDTFMTSEGQSVNIPESYYVDES